MKCCQSWEGNGLHIWNELPARSALMYSRFAESLHGQREAVLVICILDILDVKHFIASFFKD